MIRYQLKCDKAHEFEGWFASSSAYDDQVARSQVACPRCGSPRVSKAPMAPGISRGSGGEIASREAVEALRRVRKKLMETSDYVGDRFADEALNIHRKEVEPRGIYGEATSREARELSEEGVAFYPVPVLPEDHN